MQPQTLTSRSNRNYGPLDLSLPFRKGKNSASFLNFVLVETATPTISGTRREQGERRPFSR